MKRWLQLLTVAAITGSSLVASTAVMATTTNNVVQLRGKISAITEDEDAQNPRVIKVSVTQNDLINLALGRPRTSPVPPNIILGIEMDCEGEAVRLIVFDTTSSSKLVELTSISDILSVGVGTKVTAGVELELGWAGNESNGILGGKLFLILKVTLDTNGCPLTVSGSVIGGITVVTDEDGFPHTLLITKGKLGGSQAGTLIEEDE